MLYHFPILLLLTLFSTDMSGQDIAKHRWENRLLLVVSKDHSNERLKDQLAVLNSCEQGLTERKLLIYQILPDKYKVSTTYENGGSWHGGSRLYEQFSDTDSSFEAILIGLDGGVKLRKKGLLECKELLAIIDTMPMRQAEIRSKK